MQREPSSIWGKGIERELGHISATITGLYQRQDDMRREILARVELAERRLEDKQGASAMGLLRLIPWDRAVTWAIMGAGAMGWLKPGWVKMLLGG
jgi:hypothetical protein